MQEISKGLWAAAFLAATASCATADPLSAILTARGNAPSVCMLGSWVKDGGPGSFSGGANALLTYGDSDLVDAESRSIVSGASVLSVHAPLLCNTQVTWGLATAKGAFRLNSGATAPGFASEWNYNILGGPYDGTGGNYVGTFTWDSNGSPNDASVTSNAARSTTVTRFNIVFSPHAQSARMLAGTYSETVTVSIFPSL